MVVVPIVLILVVPHKAMRYGIARRTEALTCSSGDMSGPSCKIGRDFFCAMAYCVDPLCLKIYLHPLLSPFHEIFKLK